MKGLVFIGKISTWSLAKKSGFLRLKVANISYGLFLLMLGAHNTCLRHMRVHKMHPWGAQVMLGAHVSVVMCINVCFFIHLRVCFDIRCLGTWEHNFSLCNVFWGLLILHSWSSQSLHKFSNELFCLFLWFHHELNQNTLKLLCFGKNRITWLKYRKHYKCPEIINNFFNTPTFWMKKRLKNMLRIT